MEKNAILGGVRPNNGQGCNAPDLAERLIGKGYMPIPIPHGQKGPVIKGWNSKSFSPADFLPGSNVGIRTGEKGIALLDVDVLDPAIAEAIVAEWKRRFAEQGPFLQRTGRAPKTSILFRSDTDLRKQNIKLSENLGQIEVLAKGQQFVAYGIHPDTRALYQWHELDPAERFAGSANDLPTISQECLADFLEWVRSSFGSDCSNTQLATTSDAQGMAVALRQAGRQAIADREVITLLYAKRNTLPSGSYDRWRDICFGVRAGYFKTDLEAEARVAFKVWSQHWENGVTLDEQVDKLWNSWKPDWAANSSAKPVGVGTAIHHLRQLPSLATVHDADDCLNSTGQPKLDVAFTGLAAQLHARLKRASDRVPSNLHVAAVVSALSALIGPCAVLQNGVSGKCCANMYVLALAHTGFGKEIIRKLIDSVLLAADRGDEVFGSSPSDVSCHSTLIKTGGRMALLIDEAGMLSKAIQSGSHGHQKMLMSLLMKLYGIGLTRLEARRYHDSKKDIEAVERPRPSLLLTSTVTEFVEGTSREDSSSGFLNRFTAFVDGDYVPLKPRTLSADVQAVVELPTDTVAAIKHLSSIHIGPEISSRLPEVQVFLTPEARERLVTFKYDVVEPKQRMGGIRSETWVRAVENAQRLATCLAVSDVLMDASPDLSSVPCDNQHVELALTIIGFGAGQLERLASRAGGGLSHVERMKDRVLSFLQENKGKATTSQIGRGPLRGMNSQMRHDLLGSMISDGEILSQEAGTGGRLATVYSLPT